ncbi:uncharacterized protein LOC132058893 isoform X3 [Lycium ferocissimum]|uniref:uncharacterized protein LOC132058893 isoform X3 n=1 Tax=Lycium ferocissimum TaxID=112874 RepID=UPI002816152B|nr:uncharacterized protein LOC132058893 isoform X3 [Lycium ferocissimum]
MFSLVFLQFLSDKIDVYEGLEIRCRGCCQQKRDSSSCKDTMYHIYKDFTELSLIDEDAFEFLLIMSTEKAKGRSGKDETIEDAAQCETVEEAGVQVLLWFWITFAVQTGRGRWYVENKTGDIACEGHMFPLLVTEQLDSWPKKEICERTWCKLGRWYFENKAGDTAYEGHMFPLFVTEQLDYWPENEIRERTWMNVREARKFCLNGAAELSMKMPLKFINYTCSQSSDREVGKKMKQSKMQHNVRQWRKLEYEGMLRWYFENRTGNTAYEGHMFPLFVTEQLDSWPEKEIHERTWMNVREARKLCQKRVDEGGL